MSEKHTAVEVASFVQWAARRGLTTTADVDSHIHAGLRSAKQTKTYKRWYEAETLRLSAARSAALDTYRAEVLAGRVVNPDDDKQGRLERTAAGHPDNPSVQAARRILAARALATNPEQSA